MLRTNITQKQREVSQRNVLSSTFSHDAVILEPSFVIKTMIKIIKIRTKDSMSIETRMQFLKFSDAIMRLIEDISE